jgi:ABC-type transport system involved in multi-copper enzyme maturation permease subunit
LGRGSLNRIGAVAANTFRETVRERVLYNLVFFAILMTLCGVLLGELSIRQDEKIIKDIGFAAMDVFGLLIALFIGVGLVNKEVERRSLYPLLSKPLDRDEFLIGKFAGLSLTLLVNISLMTAGLYLTLLATGREVSPALLEAIYPIFLGLLLVVALAVLFSTLTSAPLAAVFTFGLALAGRYSDVVQHMREVAPGAPQWLVTFLYWVIPNFRYFDFKDKVAYGDPVAPETLVWVTAYAAAYIVVALGAAMLAFRSKELQ